MKNNYNLIELEDFCSKKILDVNDLQIMFGVGKAKARKIIKIVPHFKIGKKYFCTRINLFNFINSDDLDFNW